MCQTVSIYAIISIARRVENMNIGLISVVIILLILFVIKSIVNLSLKIIGLSILIILAGFTFWICTAKPVLHKPISLNTIEYLLKINKDGSVTTTKQITQTIIKQEVGD